MASTKASPRRSEPGCHCTDDNPKPHNKECRARFEKLIREERERAPMADQQPEAGDSAQDAGGSAEAGGTAQQAGGTAPAGGSAGPSAGGTATASGAGDSAPRRVVGSPTPSSAEALRETKRTRLDPVTRRTLKRDEPAERPQEDVQRAQRLRTEPGDDPMDQAVSDLLAALVEEEQEVDHEDRPTLQSVPVAGYPEWARLETVLDEKTGEVLEPDKVRRARSRELDKMDEHSVKRDITIEEANKRGLKVVRSRWVDTRKALPEDPRGVRSRLVAQELNQGPRDDTFAGTPPFLWVHRTVVSRAATQRRSDQGGRRLIGRYDVSVAFFHAESTGGIAVKPPPDLFDQEHYWLLLKAMNGTREASRQRGLYIKHGITPAGFMGSAAIPGLYYHPEWDIMMACHGDDFLAEGLASDLDRLDELMKSKFEVKILPRIGDPEFGGEVSDGSHLHRIIRWSAKGFSWEADPKYAVQLAQEMGLRDCKGVDTPASKDTGKNERNTEDPLFEKDAKWFRKLAGTALYLSLDRPTIQFAVSQVATGMTNPTEMHMLQLKRLVRYLVKYPTEQWKYNLQQEPKGISVYSDSDWATCGKTRKSMSAMSIRYGEHLIDCSCARQSLIALSSGEAEFYALTRAASAGLLVKAVFEEMRMKADMTCLTDSSAAKGITARKGVGKVKHLSLKELWVQDAIDEKKFKVQKESTDTNWADLGTKALDNGRILQLLKIMPLKRAAMIASILVFADCQGDNDEGQESASGLFWMYLLMVHLFALFGLTRLILNFVRLIRQPKDAKSGPLQTDRQVQVPELSAANRSVAAPVVQRVSHGDEGLHRRSVPAEAESKAEVEDEFVWTIGNGHRYHRQTCGMILADQNRPRISRVRRSQAVRAGLTPCLQCKPR